MFPPRGGANTEASMLSRGAACGTVVSTVLGLEPLWLLLGPPLLWLPYCFRCPERSTCVIFWLHDRARPPTKVSIPPPHRLLWSFYSWFQLILVTRSTPQQCGQLLALPPSPTAATSEIPASHLHASSGLRPFLSRPGSPFGPATFLALMSAACGL